MNKLKIRIKRPFQRSSPNSATGSTVAFPSASHELSNSTVFPATSLRLSWSSNEFPVPSQSSWTPPPMPGPSVTMASALEPSGKAPVAVAPKITSPGSAISFTPTATSGPVTPITPLSTQNVRRAGWTGLEALARALQGTTTSAFAPLRSAVDNIADCVDIFENAAESHKGYGTLRVELDTLFHDLAGHFGATTPPGATSSIVNLAKGIDRELDLICRKRGRNPYWRFLQAEKDIDDALECYRRIQGMLQRLALNANISIWKIADEQATVRNRLDKLPPSHAAWYSSAESTLVRRDGCTLNTRVAVLEQLREWTDDGESEKVYWLNGMAGTGKTTIAYSLCEQLNKDSRLAASFFCSRQLPNCRDVNLILPTISYQLARFSLPFRHALSGALEQNPDARTQRLRDQFNELIAKPLRAVSRSIPSDLVVVIDALDECDSDDGIGQILDILLSHASDLPIRFFVTSRPEPEIRDMMLRRRGERQKFELHLHDLEKSIVAEDIKTYLHVKLAHANLASVEVDCLAERSGVLFIYAATAARYILADNCSRSSKRLRTVLDAHKSSSSNVNKHIDTLYAVILQAAFDDNDLDDSDRREMMLALCTIICAKELLTVDTMATLLGLGEADVRTALRPLLSVLNLQGTQEIITTLHQSFPDYLIDRNRSPGFWCDVKSHNAWLARRCFDLMKIPNPPFNICNLDSSYVFDNDVPDLGKRVEEAISNGLFYACRYWGAHLLLAEGSPYLIKELNDWLSVRLLLWMEVMNLKRALAAGTRLLYQVQTWCKSLEYIGDIKDLAMDAYCFVAAFTLSPARRSTPHIYVSGLAFWPPHRPVSRIYHKNMRGLTIPSDPAIPNQEFAPLVVRRMSGRLSSISVSSNGTHIVSSSEDHITQAWDAHTLQKISEPLKWASDLQVVVAISPNGAWGMYESQELFTRYCFRIGDVITHQTIGGLFIGHTGAITSGVFSPDCARVVSGSSDNTLRIWDVQTGQMIGKPLEGHTSTVYSIAYSPDGKYIASGSYDHTLRIWDACAGRAVVEPLKGHTAAVCSVAYLPDGTRIVSGSFDGTVRIWDAHTGNAITNPLLGHRACVYSVACSPNGAYIVSGSEDTTIRIWNAHTGQIIGKPLENDDSVLLVAYTSDGECIISGSKDYTLRLWDARINQTSKIPPRVRTTTVSSAPSRSSRVLSKLNSALQTWGAQSSNTTRPTGGSLAGYTAAARTLACSPDGAHFVSGSDDNIIRIWDLRTRQTVNKPLSGHTDHVRSVSYSPDGFNVASSSDDTTIRIWDVQSGRMIGKPFVGHTDTVLSIAYSPDGAYIVSGSGDSTIRIWDVEAGRELGEPLQGHVDGVHSVAYSSNGARIVSGSADGTVCIWNARTGRMVNKPLIGHNDSVYSVAFSPDGFHIASGSADTTICVWDARTGRIVGEPLMNHTSAVHSVAYLSDGVHMISGSSDGTIILWDTGTGLTVGRPLEGHTNGILSIACLPSGTQVVSSSLDCTIRTWDLTADQLHRNRLGTSSKSLAYRFPSGPESHASAEPNEPFVWVEDHLDGCLDLDEDGWVVTNDSKVIFWVPHELRMRLRRGLCTAVIPGLKFLEFDFGNLLLGEQWKFCYRPN